jgi:glycosyltransferase involved in cell wall biosynthesis
MKILLLIDGFGSGGAQRQMVTLSILFKENGHNVSFLTYSDDDFFQKKVEENNINIYRIETNNYINRIFKVRKFIREGKYDAVISFMDVPNFLNNFAAIGRKRWRVITSERSSKESYFLSIQGIIFGWFQRFSDLIVCNSNNAKEMWKKYYPSYSNKIKVIYNPVVLPKISSEYTARKDGKINIVVAASYQYLKNPVGLVKALVLLNEEEKKRININWYGKKNVSITGVKAYEETYKIIQENNLNSVIQLHEETDDILNKMHESDIIALFSKLEGLPNVICEGMMIGKPIIMSCVSDFSELVDESNGFLCEWNKLDTIRNAILATVNLTNDELAIKGENSRKKAEKLFRPNIILSNWLDAIGITES